MQFAGWLLVTASLVTPAAEPVKTAPAVATASATPAVSFDAAQQRSPLAPTNTVPSHRFGVGASLAVSNYGVSGSTRFWISKHVGVSMAAGWLRPPQYGYVGYQNQVSIRNSSTLTASPSVLVSFNSTDPAREVSLRPFVGAGVTYMHATSRTIQPVGVTSVTFDATMPVALGGTEIFFRDHPRLTLSAEGVYYRVPVSFVNRAYVSGLGFQVSAHFYLK